MDATLEAESTGQDSCLRLRSRAVMARLTARLCSCLILQYFSSHDRHEALGPLPLHGLIILLFSFSYTHVLDILLRSQICRLLTQPEPVPSARHTTRASTLEFDFDQ